MLVMCRDEKQQVELQRFHEEGLVCKAIFSQQALVPVLLTMEQ